MRIFGRKLARENNYLKNELSAKEKDITALRIRVEELETSVEILNNSIDKVKKICKKTKSGVVGKAKILKELGE